MGQAKNRGTKEERIVLGIAKRTDEQLEREAYRIANPPKPNPKLTMLMALANSFAPKEVVSYECDLARQEREKRSVLPQTQDEDI
jgi:DNA-binding XRE family transcriptional regulator